MATGGKANGSRAARERARLYQARQQQHAREVGRRRRDNLLAGVVGGLVVLAAIGGQVAHFTAGPGAPAPAPSTSSTPAPTTSTSPGVAPSEQPSPTPSTPAG